MNRLVRVAAGTLGLVLSLNSDRLINLATLVVALVAGAYLASHL